MTSLARPGNAGRSSRLALPGLDEVARLIALFAAEYTNSNTVYDHTHTLWSMFRHTGSRSVHDLTRANVAAWCVSPPDIRSRARTTTPANNTVRKRAHTAKSFIDWCEEEGHLNPALRLAHGLSRRGGPIASHRPTYGKVQSVNPGRWLTHAEAFDCLVASCQDGTPIGRRDEIIIRLGLLGVRCSEIHMMRIGDYDPTTGELRWMGKGNKPRTAVAGDAMRHALAAYLDLYRTALQVRRLDPQLPMICQRPGNKGREILLWGTPTPSRNTITKSVVRQAEAAGLGHVTPHDLRRTAAGIMHDAVTAEGAHHFDLLDIQKQLDHSSPDVTQKCYLAPRTQEVKRKASTFLD